MLLRCCCAGDWIRKLPPKTKKSAKMFGSYGSILQRTDGSGGCPTIAVAWVIWEPLYNKSVNFVLTSVNQLWVSDITYIQLANGDVAYLHLVTDAYYKNSTILFIVSIKIGTKNKECLLFLIPNWGRICEE